MCLSNLTLTGNFRDLPNTSFGLILRIITQDYGIQLIRIFVIYEI